MYFNPSWCVLCKRNEESRDHLFLYIVILLPPFGRKLVLCSTGIILVNRFQLCANMSIVLRKETGRIPLFSTLWPLRFGAYGLERNNRTFNDKEKASSELWEDIKALMSLWTSRSSLFKDYSPNLVAQRFHVNFVHGWVVGLLSSPFFFLSCFLY